MTARAQKYWSKKGASGPWDYIVIGSGMGGMTAAAFLAKLGRRVLVLEQHYVPGGFTHTFKRKGWEWDVGVHAVGEVTNHSLSGRLLNHITEGQLKWASLGPVYDAFHYPDGFEIDFPDTPQKFRNNLLAAFPKEQAGIDGYFKVVREVAGSMRNYYLSRAAPRQAAPILDRLLARTAQSHLLKQTEQVIAELTDDEHLRAVLVAQWGYYGSTPSRSSFAMQALVAKHFMHGGYYPVGGSGSIASGLLGTVSRAGGYTRIHADVQQIMVENERAVGVRLTTGEEIRAGRVISAAGVVSTLQRLLPADCQSAEWTAGIKKLPPASAHVCLYIGFEGDIRAAGAGAANQWFYETWSMEEKAWQVQPGAVPRAPVLYTSFPSMKDPLHEPGPEQRHTGEVVTFVPWSTFEPWADTRWKKRGPEYQAFKDEMKARLLEQLLERLPGLRPHVRWTELSTPVSTDHFCRPIEGSIYGIEPTPERFRNVHLRPKSPIRDLYFAGSEVTTVGVMGAMMGGALSVVAAEPVRALQALAKLRRG